MSIAERYAALRAEVPAHVGIVAVSKFQPPERVAEAIAAGVTDIGENYVQEAKAKFELLRQAQPWFDKLTMTNQGAFPHGEPLEPHSSRHGEPVEPHSSRHGEPLEPHSSRHGEPLEPHSSRHGEPVEPHSSRHGEPVEPLSSRHGEPVEPQSSRHGEPVEPRGELVEPKKHFIGHIQTNKAKAIAATFDVVQSVDRLEAAAALAKAAESLGKVLPVLLQLNISPAERFGCPPAQADELAEQIRALPALQLGGVMAIGPITEDREAIARAFELAAQTWRRIGGPVLSIGMSGDWREAVAAGSTLIRVGTTIFGPRPARPASKNALMSSP